ncbi:Protein NRT1/ PTR FAMILY 4.6, partial [Mucuna pruriens]
MAYLTITSNLVLYLSQDMHMSLSKSANNVTNFVGTAFILTLLGGFLSDAFLVTYQIYLISAVVELLGLILLSVQAFLPSLQPPVCQPNTPCNEVNGGKATMLYAWLYLVALGVGGIKGSLPAHGAEQFDKNTPFGRMQRSTFFNYFVFCLSTGALIAVTFVVWVEENKGWEWGFGISTISIFVSIPVFLAGSTTYRSKVPSGSPLATILKLMLHKCLHSLTYLCFHFCGSSRYWLLLHLIVALKKVLVVLLWWKKLPKPPKNTLKFLNRAVGKSPMCLSIECTVEQVEDVKIVLKELPIFGCTIMLNCCLAQLSTFSVEQAATMNTKIGSLKVPPASLSVFPLIFIIILAPIYDHIIIPFSRKVTKTEMGITHLQRIGIGLILSIIAMAVAAFVEVKRKRVATNLGLTDDATKPLPITFFWIALQYLFLGSADLFTFAGTLEFFFTETPIRMRSLATSLSWVSLAMGYYLSSAIVSIINHVTGNGSHKPWLSGANLSHYHLERFYWLMCVLSVLNFFRYLFWALRYRYRGITTTTE